MAAVIFCQLQEVRTFINASQDLLVRGKFEFAKPGQEEECQKLEDLCRPSELVFLVVMGEDEYIKNVQGSPGAQRMSVSVPAKPKFGKADK